MIEIVELKTAHQRHRYTIEFSDDSELHKRCLAASMKADMPVAAWIHHALRKEAGLPVIPENILWFPPQ